MNEAELLKAFEDREFTEKIFKLETIEEVQKAFKDEKNIDISFEELETLRKSIVEIVEKLQKGEMTEEELTNVSGGLNDTQKALIAAAGAVAGAALLGTGIYFGVKHFSGSGDSETDVLPTQVSTPQVSQPLRVPRQQNISPTPSSRVNKPKNPFGKRGRLVLNEAWVNQNSSKG